MAARTAAVVQKEFDAFKDAVRDQARGYVDRGDSCSDGVNDFLRNVGLEPLTEEFWIEVKIVKTVEATSKEAARQLAVEAGKAFEELGEGWEVDAVDSDYC